MKLLLLSLAVPILASVVLYRAFDFNAADYPADLSSEITRVPEHHDNILSVMEKIGEGILLDPEDMVYDASEKTIYTGCSDGWIRRVKLEDEERPVVEDWIYVGGRPLGLALGRGGDLVVANADKGLMVVEKDGSVRVLIDRAEGRRISLADGVDVADDGMIYFTDASKYGLGDYVSDFLEGRPHGRLLSYNPITNETLVLVRDLYFPNGVAISPDQVFLVFCETFVWKFGVLPSTAWEKQQTDESLLSEDTENILPSADLQNGTLPNKRRCKKYHIRNDKKGNVENWLENMPGFPDNIKYDGDGHFWIGLPAEKNSIWDVMIRYPQLRKIVYMIGKRVLEMSKGMRNGGVLKVNLEGDPVSLYTDPRLSSVTSGLRIGSRLYLGSLKKPYIGRLDLRKLAQHSMA